MRPAPTKSSSIHRIGAALKRPLRQTKIKLKRLKRSLSRTSEKLLTHAPKPIRFAAKKLKEDKEFYKVYGGISITTSLSSPFVLMHLGLDPIVATSIPVGMLLDIGVITTRAYIKRPDKTMTFRQSLSLLKEEYRNF